MFAREQPLILDDEAEIIRYSYLEKLSIYYGREKLNRVIIESAKETLNFTSNGIVLVAEKDDYKLPIPFMFNSIETCLPEWGLIPSYDKKVADSLEIPLTRGEHISLTRLVSLYHAVSNDMNSTPDYNLEQIFSYGLSVLETLVVLNLNGYLTINGYDSNTISKRKYFRTILYAEEFLEKLKEGEKILKNQMKGVKKVVDKLNLKPLKD